MATGFPATPSVGLCPAEGNDLRAADQTDTPAVGERWPLQSFAKLAALLHLGLLLLTAVARSAVQPAQAAVLAGMDATAHSGLLIASGTAAALLALAAGYQNSAAHHTAPCDTDPRRARHDQDAAAKAPAGLTDLTLGRVSSGSRQNMADVNWAELMARANHELRTPLNAVIGFSDVMQRELLGPIGHDRYKDYIRHIRESGFALLKSAEDTLAMTSLVAGRTRARATALVLEPLLRQAWCQLSHEADRFDVVLDPAALDELKREHITVSGEEQAMKQALINLFSEAIRVARPHQEICLAIETTPDAVYLTISCASGHSGALAQQPSSSLQQKHYAAKQDRPDPGGLCLAMARAMLELQGASLTEQHDGSGEWRVSLRLSPVRGA